MADDPKEQLTDSDSISTRSADPQADLGNKLTDSSSKLAKGA